MGKYFREQKAEAYQIEFTSEDKEKAKKGIPVSSHGSHIKCDGEEFSVLIHLGDDAKLAKEGDWVVTEDGGRKIIVSDEVFQETYFLDDEDDETDEEESDDLAEDNSGGEQHQDTPPPPPPPVVDLGQTPEPGNEKTIE